MIELRLVLGGLTDRTNTDNLVQTSLKLIIGLEVLARSASHCRAFSLSAPEASCATSSIKALLVCSWPKFHNSLAKSMRTW